MSFCNIFFLYLRAATSAIGTDTLDEERMRKIKMLESHEGHKARPEETQAFQKPVFTTPLGK